MLVAKRSGTFVARMPARTVEIQLRSGNLVDYTENGTSVRDVLALSDRFQNFLEQRTGGFEFFQAEGAAPHTQVAQQLAQLVSNAMGQAQDILQADAHLPSAQTRFLLTGKEGIWLQEDLQIFWERAEPHLRQAASALQLSGCTGVNVRKAQWFLYRLRLAGLVRPRRSAETTEYGLPIRIQAPMQMPAASEPGAGDLEGVKIARLSGGLFSRVAGRLAQLFR